MKRRVTAIVAAAGLAIGIHAAHAQDLQGERPVAVDRATNQLSTGSLYSVERKNVKASKHYVLWQGGASHGGGYSLSVGRAMDFFNRGVPSSVVSQSNGTVEIAAIPSAKAPPSSASSPQLTSSIDRTNHTAIRGIVVEGVLAGPKTDERLDDAMSRAQVIQPYVVFDDSQINILTTLLR